MTTQGLVKRWRFWVLGASSGRLYRKGMSSFDYSAPAELFLSKPHARKVCCGFGGCLVFLLQQLFDWLVLMPARMVALFAIVPVSSLPALAAIGSWFWVVRVIDGRHNGRPANWRTFVAATLIPATSFW